jgi:hypothetical protein
MWNCINKILRLHQTFFYLYLFEGLFSQQKFLTCILCNLKNLLLNCFYLDGTHLQVYKKLSWFMENLLPFKHPKCSKGLLLWKTWRKASLSGRHFYVLNLVFLSWKILIKINNLFQANFY